MRAYTLRFVSLTLALALVGCGAPPSDSAYLNRGDPASLLDASSEVISFSTASKHDLKELGMWIERDAPTRAELNCASDDKLCGEARRLLIARGVPVEAGAIADRSVTLIYERILAHDCDHRFVDNTHNYYNTSDAAFGCSVAANMVQQVTDKQEFVNPNTAGKPSAVRAVNDIKRAYTPRPIVEPYKVGDSSVAKAKTQ